jgi:hypothetical protein
MILENQRFCFREPFIFESDNLNNRQREKSRNKFINFFQNILVWFFINNVISNDLKMAEVKQFIIFHRCREKKEVVNVCSTGLQGISHRPYIILNLTMPNN